MLDEATANVDNETDIKLQNTMAEEFRDSTIVCIAHRIRSVIESDKIIVMESGKVGETGTPKELLEKEEGYFRRLVEELGPTESEILKNRVYQL